MRLRLPILLIILTTAFFLGSLRMATAQSKEKPIDKDSPSWVLKQKKKNDAKKDFPKQEYPRYIIITETKGLLYGNPCALQETHKMGFEYVLLKEGQPGYETMWKKMTNNFFVKTGLVFRRSPFWKLILKNRIEDCRVNTGDFIGDSSAPEPLNIEAVSL
ncbi:MAG: hypothetical protein RIB71_03925 [Imperialibacter sp.]|uniref:hypothetical protein n=1 Tax=Imperialibacter sp. TaxID=2038411 RepID=UPI0032EF06B4